MNNKDLNKCFLSTQAKIFLSGLGLTLPTLIPSQPAWQMFLEQEQEKEQFSV